MFNAVMVLIALGADGELYAREICTRVERLTGRPAFVDGGGIYSTLRRLLDRGLVVARWGDGGVVEGSRRRYYALTSAGVAALEQLGEMVSFAC